MWMHLMWSPLSRARCSCPPKRVLCGLCCACELGAVAASLFCMGLVVLAFFFKTSARIGSRFSPFTPASFLAPSQLTWLLDWLLLCLQLHKIKALHPEASLVLRIRTDDSKAKCPLSNKYGANMSDVPSLLDTAKSLGLNVVGVSYHVGSGCTQLDSYSAALKNARTVFDIAHSKGIKMNLLDIGGGFPGSGSDTSDVVSTTGEPSPTSFVDIAGVIRKTLNSLFPASSGVRVIAEPGRYFVEGAFVLCTNVISRRVTAPTVVDTEGVLSKDGEYSGVRKFSSVASHAAPEHTRYYINDGVYGSFNCVVYDHAVVRPVPLTSSLIASDLPTFHKYIASSSPVHVTAAGPGSVTEERPCAPGEHPSSVWGQTCDGFDVVLPKVNLPRLAIGDWLCFENMGAYTVAAGSTFNGFPKPEITYLYDDGDVKAL